MRFSRVIGPALLLAATWAGAAGQERVTAVVGATLIDGTGRAPLRDAVLLVRDGRIAAVGARDSVEIPAGAERVNVEGKYIIPGLIDGHVHYRSWVGELFLNYGVTSVVDIGNLSEWMVALREGIAKGKITRTPRLYASGYILNGLEPPGFQTFSDIIRIVSGVNNKLNFEDPEAARRHVARMLDEDHLDVVKVYQQLPPRLLAAVADEAHRRGKRVVGHTANAYESVEAGMDGVEHLGGIFANALPPADLERLEKNGGPYPHAQMDPARVDRVVRFLAERRAFVNPTLAFEFQSVSPRARDFRAEVFQLLATSDLQYIPSDARASMLSGFDRTVNGRRRFGDVGNFPYLTDLSAEALKHARDAYAQNLALVRRLSAAGVRIWFGTDTGGTWLVPGLSTHHELQLEVDAGLTPMQAIESATRTVAELLNRTDDLGTVQQGRFADFVVLDADPLADIANTRKIAMVFLGGERVERGYHWNYSIPLSNPGAITDAVMVDYSQRPRLDDVTPKMAVAGDAATTIKVTGTAFTTRTVVAFNGVTLETTFETPTALSARVPASLLTTPGTWSIQVSTPAPGGGRSNALGFIVRFR